MVEAAGIELPATTPSLLAKVVISSLRASQAGHLVDLHALISQWPEMAEHLCIKVFSSGAKSPIKQTPVNPVMQDIYAEEFQFCLKHAPRGFWAGESKRSIEAREKFIREVLLPRRRTRHVATDHNKADAVQDGPGFTRVSV